MCFFHETCWFAYATSRFFFQTKCIQGQNGVIIWKITNFCSCQLIGAFQYGLGTVNKVQRCYKMKSSDHFQGSTINHQGGVVKIYPFAVIIGCSDFQVGGWVGTQKFEHCSDFEIRWKKWMLPYSCFSILYYTINQ